MSSRRLVQFVALLVVAEALSTATFLEELRTDMALLLYAVVGAAVTLLVLWLISRNRSRLF